MEQEVERSRSKLHEMVVRGSNYREDAEVEVFGEDVDVQLRTLVDDEFFPIITLLAEQLGIDDLDEEEAVTEAIDEAEDFAGSDDIEVSDLDEEFVEGMQAAAIMGLSGAYDEDGELYEFPEGEEGREEKALLVENMTGGSSVELGGRVLDVSGDVRDAEKFRGGRGRVDGSRDS